MNKFKDRQDHLDEVFWGEGMEYECASDMFAVALGYLIAHPVESVNSEWLTRKGGTNYINLI